MMTATARFYRAGFETNAEQRNFSDVNRAIEYASRRLREVGSVVFSARVTGPLVDGSVETSAWRFTADGRVVEVA
jgi:hypothetical protein